MRVALPRGVDWRDTTKPWRGSALPSDRQLSEKILAFHSHLLGTQPQLLCADICMLIAARVRQHGGRRGLNGLLDYCSLTWHKALFVNVISSGFHGKDRRSFSSLSKWGQVDVLARAVAKSRKSSGRFLAVASAHGLPIRKCRRLMRELQHVLAACVGTVEKPNDV